MRKEKMNKKGKLEWEYLAAIVLVLLIIVVLLLFSENIGKIIMERGKKFFSEIIPGWVGQ